MVIKRNKIYDLNNLIFIQIKQDQNISMWIFNLQRIVGRNLRLSYDHPFQLS